MLRAPRHPVIGPAVSVPTTSADPPGVVHASVADQLDPRRSAGGGAARTLADARLAASGEAIERMVASHARIPVRPAAELIRTGAAVVPLSDWTLHSSDQRGDPRFPHHDIYDGETAMALASDLVDDSTAWIPAALVTLSDRHGAMATSSGLAAHPSVYTALLRAVEELIERDALVTTWLHGLGGREVTGTPWHREADDVGARIRVFDLTPRFSPHPVAVVTGSFPLAGRPRHSLGAACRARWDDAVEKAFLECCQGVMFAGHLVHRDPGAVRLEPDDVRDFDAHAAFYTARPERWADLPLFTAAVPVQPPPDAPAADAPAGEQLRAMADALRSAGIRLLSRELTTVEANQLGVRVVRVASPELTPIHHDHRWPFLGGNTAAANWRWPDASSRCSAVRYPSPHPHPLG